MVRLACCTISSNSERQALRTMYARDFFPRPLSGSGLLAVQWQTSRVFWLIHRFWRFRRTVRYYTAVNRAAASRVQLWVGGGSGRGLLCRNRLAGVVVLLLAVAVMTGGDSFSSVFGTQRVFVELYSAFSFLFCGMIGCVHYLFIRIKSY